MIGIDSEIELSAEYHQLLEQAKPGAALKLMRESKSVELADIATDTLIPAWKLSDLENDCYEGLGGDTFVTGYIRKIAKILDIESDDLVIAFNLRAEIGAEDGVSCVAKSVASRPHGSGPVQQAVSVETSLLGKLNKLPGFIAVAALLLVWVGATLFLPSPVATSESLPLSSGAKTQEPLVDLPVEKAEVTVDSVDSEAAEFDHAIPPLADSSVVLPEAPSDQALLDSSTSSVIGGSETTDLLVLTFIDECWVKVSDTTGKVLFAEAKLKGDNLQLFGEAPFEVMLGNARAVDVTLNGQPFAIHPSPSRKTLRVTVHR